MKKNKSIICIILFITMIISSISFAGMTSYADQMVDGSFKYTASTGTLEIYSDANMLTYPADKISSFPWYDYKSAIKHIIVHEGVTKISDYAFCMEDNLEDISIASTVTSIGNGALAGNGKLKRIYVPSSVTSIGETAFGYNANMELTPGFVCECDVMSYAQEYCLKNYIKFSTPIAVNDTTRIDFTEKGGKQAIWSYTAPGNMMITFYSTGNQDTMGLIYDADDYIYSEKYSTMRDSAIVEMDDYNGNLNYRIQLRVEKGKTYYLSTRLAYTSVTGGYDVHFEEECITHSYELMYTTATCTQQGVKVYACENCGTEMHVDVLATGHNYTVEHTDATCDTNGKDIYTCQNCGDQYTNILYANGHNLVTRYENRIDATCTTDGSYTVITACTICGKETQHEDVIVNANGHSYNLNGLSRDGDGVMDIITIECDNCGDTKAMRFSDQLNKTADELGDSEFAFDFNEDGYVNAKDYAMLYHFVKYGYLVTPDE